MLCSTAVPAPSSGSSARTAAHARTTRRVVVATRAPCPLTRSRSQHLQLQLQACRSMSFFSWRSMRGTLPVRSSSSGSSVVPSVQPLEECNGESCENVAAQALASLSSEKQTRVPRTAEEVAKGDSQYIVGTYVRPPVLFTHGKGESVTHLVEVIQLMKVIGTGLLVIS